MSLKQYIVLSVLGCILCINTVLITREIYINFHRLTILSGLMPILGFHFIAFIISFIHWFLDTWTVSNDSLRIRTFNQAKTHHYYPHLVVEKDIFARNDDAIYGSIMFGTIYLICYSSLNVQIFMYSTMLSVLASLEIHRYAHMPVNQVPHVIRLLQRSGIILSRESHYRHHNGKFHQSYDLMSGIMNTIVDWIGIYPMLEKIITKLTGLQPRTYLSDPKQKEELKSYYKSHSE